MTRLNIVAGLFAAALVLPAAAAARGGDAAKEGGGTTVTRTAPATRPAAGDQAALDKWFAELLTNATLAGGYTLGNDPNLRQDRYTIVKAAKGEGDNWVITARIEYRGIGVPVDITVPVKWAGDTPVISLTDYRVPGFGTFTARVMFHGNEYAGIWAASDHGGLMWGRIEHNVGGRAAPETQPARPATR